MENNNRRYFIIKANKRKEIIHDEKCIFCGKNLTQTELLMFMENICWKCKKLGLKKINK